MSTKNKNTWASQALLEMDSITSAIKEESKNTLNSFLAEAVRAALREGCEEEDEKDYDVVDDENDTDDNEENSEDTAKSDVDEIGNDEMEGGEVAPAEPAVDAEPAQEEAPAEEMPQDGGDEGWDEFSEYQAGENTYDLTGENDYEKVVKVYKLLKDDDQVVVRQDGDMVHLSDNESGTEYVIDLGESGEEPTAEVADGEEMPNDEMSINESEFAGFGDEFDSEEDFGGDDLNGEFGAEDNIEGLEGSDNIDDLRAAIEALQQKVSDIEQETNGMNNNLKENKKSRKPMKESKEVLFEVDLGYTDNYQDEDPIAGLSNDEPSKSGKSWHKGVPTGTKKPWAGQTKSKGEPFAKVVSEEDDMGGEMPVEEGATSVSSQSLRKATKSRTSEPRRENAPKVTKKVSTAQRGYEDVVNENKKLKKTVKELKEAIIAIKGNLSEAYVTNANLGKITKLFLENTTSQAEKVDIVNRFSNEAKTIEQSKALYESIKRELNKTTTNVSINESVKVENKELNENKVYKSEDLIKTINFMERVLKC